MAFVIVLQMIVATMYLIEQQISYGEFTIAIAVFALALVVLKKGAE